MLRSVCITSHTVIPAASSFPSLSGADIAIFNPLQRNTNHAIMINVPPRNPSSSNMTAKMESVKAVFSTRYPNLCLD